MAQISFDAIPETTNENSGQQNSVDFFNLRNDGDEAIVRIMHDSTSSFNIFTVHDQINVGGKRRKVNCIRDPQAATAECPLCASGNGIVNRIYINMLQYTQNQQGQIEAKPVVWERSLAYATRLKNLIDEYGPLSESIFKIKRCGAAGSMDTTYEIFFCNPKVFRDDLYPRVDDAFNSYSALGTIILNKNFNDLNTFVATGSFPNAGNGNQQQTQAAPAPMSYQPKAEAPVATPAQPVYQQPVTPSAPTAVPMQPVMAPTQPSPVAPPIDTPPWEQTQASSTSPGRPATRYY